jgi:hypothetical protein
LNVLAGPQPVCNDFCIRRIPFQFHAKNPSGGKAARKNFRAISTAPAGFENPRRRIRSEERENEKAFTRPDRLQIVEYACRPLNVSVDMQGRLLMEKT